MNVIIGVLTLKILGIGLFLTCKDEIMNHKPWRQ